MNAGLSSAPPPAAALRLRVIAASTIGNAFEWFDFTLFGLFALVIASQIFPVESRGGSLLLGTATLGIAFVFRPVGGLVFGVYADRVGRKLAVALMVLLMALATACMGLIPGYAAIGIAAPVLMVMARILQGFSAGGEFTRHRATGRICAAGAPWFLRQFPDVLASPGCQLRGPCGVRAEHRAVVRGTAHLGLAGAVPVRHPGRAGGLLHPPAPAGIA